MPHGPGRVDEVHRHALSRQSEADGGADQSGAHDEDSSASSSAAPPGRSGLPSWPAVIPDSLGEVSAQDLGAAQVDVGHVLAGDVELGVGHDPDDSGQRADDIDLLGAQQRDVTEVERARGRRRELRVQVGGDVNTPRPAPRWRVPLRSNSWPISSTTVLGHLFPGVGAQLGRAANGTDGHGSSLPRSEQDLPLSLPISRPALAATCRELCRTTSGFTCLPFYRFLDPTTFSD